MDLAIRFSIYFQNQNRIKLKNFKSSLSWLSAPWSLNLVGHDYSNSTLCFGRFPQMLCGSGFLFQVSYSSLESLELFFWLLTVAKHNKTS